MSIQSLCFSTLKWKSTLKCIIFPWFSTSLKLKRTMPLLCFLFRHWLLKQWLFLFLLLSVNFQTRWKWDGFSAQRPQTSIFYFVNCQCPTAITVNSYSQFSPWHCWFCFLFVCDFPTNRSIHRRENETCSYSYVVCWQKQTKELMQSVWINNNFTHSCFIISYSASAIIRNIA